MSGGTALLRTEHLKKYFSTSSGMLHAVDDVTLSIEEGKTLGVVGESGCGKSTLGRTILGLTEATAGAVYFRDEDVTHLKRAQRRRAAAEDADHLSGSLLLSESPDVGVRPDRRSPQDLPPVLHPKRSFRTGCSSLWSSWALTGASPYSYPHELDGGRRQRIGIARALALDPEFIVCDEPVSALDVSIQAQILNLLQDLQAQKGLTYMFITHDLSVVKHISDDILVMYTGCMVEKSPADDLFDHPLHPYTKGLLSAIPIPDIERNTKRILLTGEISSPIDPAPCCRFASRCPYATPECLERQPDYEEVLPQHFVACHHARDINGL